MRREPRYPCFPFPTQDCETDVVEIDWHGRIKLIYAIEKWIPILNRLIVIKRETTSQSTWPLQSILPQHQNESLQDTRAIFPFYSSFIPRLRASSGPHGPACSVVFHLACLPHLIVCQLPLCTAPRELLYDCTCCPVPWGVSSAPSFSLGVFLSLFCPQAISRKGLLVP